MHLFKKNRENRLRKAAGIHGSSILCIFRKKTVLFIDKRVFFGIMLNG